jgi:predicted HTH domain antitoxin
MATVRFEVADEAMEVVSATSDEFACAVRLAAAMFWYRRSDVTLGTAAAIAGLSQAQFMHALKSAGEGTVVVDPDDLDRELAFLAERRSLSTPGE